MRICTRNSDGKLIEAQSGGNGQADLDTLVANAARLGYQASAVTAKYVTDAEFAALLAASQPPPPDLSDPDNHSKAIKALALVMASWNGKTVPQLKAAFRTAWNSLP